MASWHPSPPGAGEPTPSCARPHITRRLPNKPTSRKAGKLANTPPYPPVPAPSTRAGCPSFSPYPAGKPHHRLRSHFCYHPAEPRRSHPATTPPLPANFPTFQQIGKPTSRQVGKLAPTPPSSRTPPPPCIRCARLHRLPCTHPPPAGGGEQGPRAPR